MQLSYPFHCVGFTQEIPYYMKLADFFIGKPGPGSISEALVMGLPVIVERNAWTMVQERFNTDWIAQNGFGVVLPSIARDRERGRDDARSRTVQPPARERSELRQPRGI